MPSLRSTRSADKNTHHESAEEQGEQYDEQYDDEIQEDEEDDDEAETRCICGQADPPDENGLFIQCEKCSVWQHGYCVSISEKVPEKYWCEKCKPELHTIVIRPDRKMTKYLPVQPKASLPSSNKRKNRRAASAGSNGKDVKKEDSIDEAIQKKRRDRGTYSTREDARYEALIQRVMEESKKDAATSEQEEENELRSARSTRRRQTRSDGNDDPDQENDEEQFDQDEEEQHEKEQNEIKKESNGEGEDEQNLDEELDRKRVSSKRKRSEEASDSTANGSTNQQSSGVPEKNSSRQQVKGSKGSAGSNESGSNNESASSKSTTKKRAKKSKVVHKSPQKDKDPTIDFSKPTKPRLPNQRTTMNEMRKRVAAILEFIGRTQIDIANEQKEQSELTKYVEEDSHKQNIEKLFENYHGSLESMDALTRKLLLWEKQFGKYGEK